MYKSFKTNWFQRLKARQLIFCVVYLCDFPSIAVCTAKINYAKFQGWGNRCTLMCSVHSKN